MNANEIPLLKIQQSANTPGKCMSTCQSRNVISALIWRTYEMTLEKPESTAKENTSTTQQSLFTEEIKELVAIGAAVAGNCEKCFTYHYEKAIKLGISKEDMLQAATLGKAIKGKPSQILDDLVQSCLIVNPPPIEGCDCGGKCC